LVNDILSAACARNNKTANAGATQHASLLSECRFLQCGKRNAASVVLDMERLAATMRLTK
jgi:hypothetical protein